MICHVHVHTIIYHIVDKLSTILREAEQRQQQVSGPNPKEQEEKIRGEQLSWQTGSPADVEQL